MYAPVVGNLNHIFGNISWTNKDRTIIQRPIWAIFWQGIQWWQNLGTENNRKDENIKIVSRSNSLSSSGESMFAFLLNIGHNIKIKNII